jgi:diguanylate cyclase (GGDEF)-like protein
VSSHERELGIPQLGQQTQDIADLDQTVSDTEQTSADMDQTLSDSDQTRSERDQISSDRDQAAADLDQAARDEDPSHGDDELAYERTRRMRADSTLERHTASTTRGVSSIVRDGVAEQRDRLAGARDLASFARDQLSAALDAEIEQLEHQHSAEEQAGLSGRAVQARAAKERRLAAKSRARAALQRQAAADDREHATRDREFAALDRKAYARELATAATDEVTGALRRGVGLAAVQREMDRTRRSGEQLVIAFIDVDGLKAVNDEAGHPAGDALLRTVVRLVSQEFRSYDLILRFGGDEFVCSFSGDGLDEIGKRFERVGRQLENATPGASISVGVSQRRPEDTIDTLLERADTKMIATRRECRRRATGIDLDGELSLADEIQQLQDTTD